jgi:hypothetical protein
MKIVGNDFLGRTDGIRVRLCVGCGYCCIKTPCDASRRLYRGADHCPQLLWIEEDKRYKCGLMIIAGLVGEGYRKELYAGEGCCSGLNSWRQDVKKRDRIDKNNHGNPLDPVFQIFLRCMGGNFISGDSMQLAIIQMQPHLEERGYSKIEINHIKTSIVQVFSQNQSSFMKGFVG